MPVLVLVRGVEATIGHERMQMHEQPQVVAKALHHDEHARVQGSATRQAVRALGEPSKRLHDPGGETLAYRAEQRPVVAQPHRQRPGKREHPLPPRHRGKAMLDQQGGGLAHPAAHTRRTDAAALAGEGDPEAVATALALGDEEAVLEVAAGEQRLELITDERGQRARTLLEAVAKRGPVFPHQREGVTVLGASRDILRTSVTAGHRRRCASRASRPRESFQALGRRSVGQVAHGWASARATGPTPTSVPHPAARHRGHGLFLDRGLGGLEWSGGVGRHACGLDPQW